jgi:hypothetical protein
MKSLKERKDMKKSGRKKRIEPMKADQNGSHLPAKQPTKRSARRDEIGPCSERIRFDPPRSVQSVDRL